MDELLNCQKQGLKEKGLDGLGGPNDDQGARRLEDEFEPSILLEMYMIVKDDEICEIGVPQRFQVCKIYILVLNIFSYLLLFLIHMFENLKIKVTSIMLAITF